MALEGVFGGVFSGVLFLFFFVLIFVFLIGIRIVNTREKAVIKRLGRQIKIYEKPGFYWIIPGIDRMKKYDKNEKIEDDPY